jgi:hypothetical protein
MRTCRACSIPKPLDQFRIQRNKPGGYDTICKPCYRLRNKSYNSRYRNTLKGCVQNSWNRMNWRVNHDPAYMDIKVQFTRSQFFAWALPAYRQWIQDNPGKTPSLDRVRPAEDYAPGNVRVLELHINCQLPKRHKSERGLARGIMRQCATHQLNPATVADLILQMSKNK